MWLSRCPRPHLLAQHCLDRLYIRMLIIVVLATAALGGPLLPAILNKTVNQFTLESSRPLTACQTLQAKDDAVYRKAARRPLQRMPITSEVQQRRPWKVWVVWSENGMGRPGELPNVQNSPQEVRPPGSAAWRV